MWCRMVYQKKKKTTEKYKNVYKKMGKNSSGWFYILFFLCVRNIQFSFLFWNDLLVQNKRKIKLYEHKKKKTQQPNEERRLLMCILFNNYLTINSNRVLWIKNYVYRLLYSLDIYIYPTCIYVYLLYFIILLISERCY